MKLTSLFRLTNSISMNGVSAAAKSRRSGKALSRAERGVTEHLESRQLLAVNPIVAENALPGTPQSQWDVSGAGDPTLQGFATDMSVNQGQTVSFKITDTALAPYHLDIYRMGFYGGNGARLVATVDSAQTQRVAQPAPTTDPTTGLIDAGNWSVTASWAVPATATSGIYFAKAVREDTGGASHIMFIVRADDSHSDLLFKTSDATWQAYNSWGGNSLYGGSPAGRAFKVSYNRPFNVRYLAGGLGSFSWVFHSEYPMVRFLEANGYDVSYFTDVDAERLGGELLEHKAFLSVGHDEYWSGNVRAKVEAARDAGVNLAFFSGNEVFWKTRFENSIDGTNSPNRTLVSYKETKANDQIDPQDPVIWTGSWMDPRFSPPADGGRPQNALTGQLYTVDRGSSDDSQGGTPFSVPASFAPLRFWRNTSVAGLTSGSATLGDRVLGYEWDEDVDNGFRPAGLFNLSSTTQNVRAKLTDYGSNTAPGTATHKLTLYRAPSGALVFGAGTVQWAWGLDGQHDDGATTPEPAIRQATINLLADMGAQPGSIQAGLVATAASTDTSAPSSAITSPLAGATLPNNVATTISGTASDAGGGVVAGVEVSTDGGITWHPATINAAAAATNWTYNWYPNGTGSTTILSRPVDDSGNLGTPSPAVTVNLSGPISLWTDAAVPMQADTPDNTALELGVKFRTDVSGTISGIRYYKSSNNTGPHVGNLWSASGALLATAAFSSESASGWQTVTFSQPVAVSAGTTYVASYHTNTGHYAAEVLGLNAAGVNNGPLHALQNGADGPNGVFATGTTSTFPTSTFRATHYYVDVLFNPSPFTPPTTAPAAPTNLTAAAATDRIAYLSWSDNSSNEAGFQIEFSTDGVNFRPLATTASNATTTASFSAGSLQSHATYTFRVRAINAAGNSPYSNLAAVVMAGSAPVARAGTLTTTEDAVATGTLVATDVDGQPLTYSLVGTADAHGTVTITDAATGAYSYSPAADYSGPARFTFKASDGFHDSNVATVSITVTAVNDAPVAVDDSYATDSRTSVEDNVLSNDADAEGDALTAVLVSGPAHGTLTLNTGTGTGPAIGDTTAADFALGTVSGGARVVTHAGDGEVALAAALVEEFSGAGPALPAGWSGTAWGSGGAASVVGGQLSVSGARAATDAGYGPGRSLEFVATFGAASFQHTGFVADPTFNAGPWAMFSTNNTTSTLYARTNAPGGSDTPISGSWLGSPHLYRIDWKATGGVDYYIDGTLVASHATSITTDMRPLASDFDAAGPALSVDWLQVSPYAASGGFESRVFDAGAAADWGAVSWSASAPAGTSVVVSVRTGNTPTPDASWTAYAVVSGPGASVGGAAARYLQYRLELSTSDPSRSPIVRDVAVSYALAGGAGGGAPGSFTYTPDAGFTGTDSFTYQARDAAGALSNLATVTITVATAGDNAAPVAEDQSVTTDEDTAASGAMAATDADGDALTYEIASGPSNGSVTITDAATGAFTYTPDADFFGSDSFTFQASDGSVDSNVATVSVTVTAVNDATVAVDDTAATPEDTVRTFTQAELKGNDADVDNTNAQLSVVAVSNASNGTVVLNPDGTVTFTPAADFSGVAGFDYVVSDGSLTDSGHVTIAVTAVNDAPVAQDGSLTTTEDTAKTGTLTAADIDSTSLTYTVASGPSHGSVLITDANTGAFTYTPDADYFGTDSFTFRASDGSLSSNVATVSVTVTAVNDAPVASAQSVTTPEDVATNGTLTATDADNAVLTYSIVSGASHGFVRITDPNTGAFEYTPAPNYNGPDSFTFQVSDGSLDSGIATVTINVSAVNDAPAASAQSIATAEDVAQSGVLAATDIDSTTLTYSIVTAPAHGTVDVTDAATGAFTYTPNANYVGTDSFTFRASDGSLDSNVATVSITVNAVNDAPVASDLAISTAEDAATGGTLTASDIDSTSLTYSLVAGPSHGTVTITDAATGAFTYTPASNYNGPDSFTFRASDGSLDSNVATVSITVTAANDAPVAATQSVTTAEDTARAGTLSATDIDGDSLTYSIVANAAHGTVVIDANTGAFTYTPAANYNGPDSFTFKASDGSLSSNNATVSINVSAVNDAPAVASTSATITVNEGDVATNTGTYLDVEGDAVTLSASVGTVVRNTNGTWSWSLNTSNGPVQSQTVTVTANDGRGGVAQTTFGLVVNNVNPTVSVTGDATGVRGQSRTFTVNFADPGADTWTATVVYGDGQSETFQNVGRSFSFSHVYTAIGNYPVKVTVQDSDGEAGSANHAPGGVGVAIKAVDMQLGDLVVGGTNAADTIMLTGISSGVVVSINGVLQGVFSPTGRVIAYGQDGNDIIQANSTLTKALELNGGGGNDTLTGGGGPTILRGGAGDDTLTAGIGGRNMMIGGDGADRFSGGSSDDILIGGRSTLDSNDAALRRIMTEWTSARTFAQRVANIRAGIFADGTNEPLLGLNSSTVIDDGAIDSLAGSAGSDWVFAGSNDVKRDTPEQLN